ncbi:MAG TPA: glycosyltransferase family 2 protein [Anaeromyxobacteraceae bacterium]
MTGSTAPAPAPARDVLVLMPAYDEGARIRSVVEAVRRQLDADVLVVDDGSSDTTAREARRAGARVASHAVNLGYGVALQTGYRFALRAGYRAVLQLDADGQHEPSCIPALLGALAGADVVVGSRFGQDGSYRPPALRRAGMWLFSRMLRALSGRRFADPTSGFQALSRRALEFYVHERYPADYPDADVLAMAIRAGLRVVEVPVRMHASPAGKGMHAGVVRPVYYVFRMLLALFLVLTRSEKR